jgi:hypothetical protein
MTTQYEQFIAANQALMDCYAGVPAEQYSAMSQWDQQQLCKNEAESVRQFIAGGHVEFRSILAERIKAFDAPKQ